MLRLRQKMQDVPYIAFSLAFVQSINDNYQFQCRSGNPSDLRQRLEDKILELLFHHLSGDARIRVNRFTEIRNNCGHRAHELSSNGGEKPRGVTALTLTSLEEEAGP